ncbi:hypothetical protein O181_035615 [Austropuccinia psidii MF-1]|uniref:Uncharacterized protein n=1 Tax=Austropuccinia psidii MF-1 TaxID=1389203 RepID=A0A9Q3D524_9BASI|nr:hypothetical protein [Austropuccinia psidii MF-1]
MLPHPFLPCSCSCGTLMICLQCFHPMSSLTHPHTSTTLPNPLRCLPCSCYCHTLIICLRCCHPMSSLTPTTYNAYNPAAPAIYASDNATPPYASEHPPHLLRSLTFLNSCIRCKGYGGLLQYMINPITEIL